MFKLFVNNTFYFIFMVTYEKNNFLLSGQVYISFELHAIFFFFIIKIFTQNLSIQTERVSQKRMHLFQAQFQKKNFTRSQYSFFAWGKR